MNFWNNFAAKHPAAAKWVREGGLFVIVSNLITVFKYLLLQFLPKAFASLPVVDFGWPGIDITLFGETFKWNILGYDAAHGGLPYFCAYMIAMVIGECINFPIQRNFVFRSKGNLAKQIGWYVLAFCVITCIVNSINCIWVAVAGLLVPDFIYNIGTTVLNGGISMVIFFFVNKIIFPEGEVPAPMETSSPFGALKGTAVKLSDFEKLTKRPILVVYGDNIPTERTEAWNLDNWRVRLAMAKLWVDAVNHHGGKATLLHLPKKGIKGNTHFLMSDTNNEAIADILEDWMKANGLAR